MIKGIGVSVVFLACCLMACEDRGVSEQLDEAERQMELSPDSSLHILNRIDSLHVVMSEGQHALWCLLVTQAQDKCYVPQGDSLIRIAVDYYEKKRDRSRLMWAYYYDAVIHHDDGDSPRAQEYYLKASKIGEELGNHALLGRIYGNMGSMYNYQGMTKEAMGAQHEAVEQFRIINDTVSLGLSIRNIGRIYVKNNQLDSAIIYYTQAIPFLSRNNRTSIYNEMGDLYGRLEQYSQAFEYVDLALTSLTEHDDTLTVYYNLGDLYRKIGQYDSAYYYLSRSLLSTNIYTRAGTNLSLSFLEEQCGNWETNARHQKQHRILQDTISKRERSQALQRTQSLYDYQQTEQKNARLEKINHQKTIFNYWIITGFSLAFVAVFLVYRRKNRLGKERHERDLRIEEQKRMQGQALIEEREKEILELKGTYEQETDQLKKGTIALKQQIAEFELEADRQKRILRKKCYDEFMKSELRQRFVSLSGKLTERDWGEFESQMRHIYPEMQSFMENDAKINKENQRFCYLVKMNVSVQRLCELFNIGDSSVSKKKARQYKALSSNKKGSAQQLFTFLNETFKDPE